jgi:hypothetical protein
MYMLYDDDLWPSKGDRRRDGLDLDELLHPAQAFNHPNDVVNDPDLTLHEKRAILSSWASDACAVESAPYLRRPPGAARAVTFDEIVDALKALDAAAGAWDPYALKRRLRKQRRPFAAKSRRQTGDEGTALGA